MSVHYKFKSALDYDTVTFDGLHISVGDLKAAISQQKRIGKTSDFDLQITNAQTKEVYVDDNTLIPKNTSLLVARVPLAQQPKKQWEGSSNSQSNPHKDVALNKGLADLSRMEGSEQDKINAMISQSTFDYDPSNYQKIRGQNQRGAVPSNYICYKCQKRGHWIKDCPAAISGDPVEIRRSTGIPRSFMVPVDGPKAPGAMMTPSGTFAVPAVDHEAYLASESAGGADTPTNAPVAPEPTIPDELICSLCRDLLTDAVMIPCCGNSFCDECIRGALLESEDHECPDCREKEIAPTTLIPNRFLRNSVSSFRNQTGYSRRAPHRPSAAPPVVEPPVPPVAPVPPNNGPVQPAPVNNDSGVSGREGGVASNKHRKGAKGEESDGSADDNITVTVPPAHAHCAPYGPAPHEPHAPHEPQAPHEPHAPHPPQRPHSSRSSRSSRHARHSNHRSRYGPPPPLKPPGMETPPVIMPRIDEQRASTPTIDERRDLMSSQVVYNRGPPSYMPVVPPPAQHYSNPAYGRAGGSFDRRFPPEPYQPPPPGIKDSPNRQEDPLEAFNRMIREKEMRAKRREEERRRALSGSRSASRERSPRDTREPRSPRSPRARLRERPPSRLRYSRSRSISRGRVRRSPWSPRRRRTRERTLSLTRSPSPRRRHRSPLRYRSPLRSPARSPPRSLPRSPLRSPPRSPLRSPLRSPPRSPLRSPPRSLAPHSPPPRTPRRSAVRSPPRPLSPHRFAGVYDELLSPPRRSVEPPFGARYPRNNIPPPGYPPITGKPMPLMANLVLPNDPPPGYRGRYDAPPFEDIPPGVEPTVPGFEPSPFEKPVFGPPGPMERDRLPPSNYRDPYRAPYVEGPSGYRDGPIPPLQSDLPGHMGEHPQRYRDNFRPTGHPYRDQGPVSYREGQPYRETGSQPPYRDGNFRNGPPPLFRDNNYRNNPFRDGNFRDNVPHNFRDGSAPFRPPSADPREPNPVPYHDPNYREGFREENNANRESRSGYRSSARNRGGSRRNANEQERHRDRDGRDRERFNENREAPERQRDVDKRSGYDKNRENRDERPRDYDRNRDYDKEKDRGHDKQSPERKQRVSPKRNRDTRESKQTESRGRSRDRESRKEKKEERTRDKSSAERSREHKEKDKKIKDRKKKKREKEKEVDKKKKRDKKDKKDKDGNKKEDEDQEKSEGKQESHELRKENTDQPAEVKAEKPEIEKNLANEYAEKTESNENVKDDLYGDEAAEAVDKEIIQNYIKAEEKEDIIENKVSDSISKDEPFDGIELQVPADELEVDIEQPNNTNNKEMLAPLPALSKWEVEDDSVEKSKEPGEITSPEEEEDGGKVTSEVIKRAENAIFAKAINSLRPIEIKKISSDRLKLYGDDSQGKGSLDNIQITVPTTNPEQPQHIDSNNKKRRYSKTPPPRLSVKERLGGKVDEVRRTREPRIVQSTVERVKSRSKTPKHEQMPYRRVTVERDRGRKPESIARMEVVKSDRRVTDIVKPEENYRSNNENEYKKRHYGKNKDEMKTPNEKRDSSSHNPDKTITPEVKTLNERERKKSVLDEAHFEPDYDENVESDNEAKADSGKKREHSRDLTFASANEPKKAKFDTETIKLDLTNVKKKPDSDSESSSDSEYSSSSSSSDARKRKKKKKKNKKKKKRAASDSDSESDSSSDDHKKKKKKRKHKKKSSKKKKKSKHK